MTTYYTTLETPMATLLLTSDGTSLSGLYVGDARHAPPIGAEWQRCDDAVPFAEAKRQATASRRPWFERGEMRSNRCVDNRSLGLLGLAERLFASRSISG